MNEERINPFIEGPADEKDRLPTKKEEPVERIVPFITDGTKTPEQKVYLLLLTFLETEESEKDEQAWMFVNGRLEARYTIMKYIKEGILDVFRSYIAVEGTPMTNDLPTVYALFTDPRSSWSRSADFGDDFNIDDYEYINEIAPEEYDEEQAQSDETNAYELNQIASALSSGTDLPNQEELPDGEDV